MTGNFLVFSTLSMIHNKIVHFKLLILFALYIKSAVSQTTAEPLSIWVAPMEVGWPTTMTVTVPESIKISDKSIFQWTFAGETSSVCTVRGQDNAPCVGRVVDHVFNETGARAIIVSVTDPTFSTPLNATTTIQILSPQEVPISQRPEIRMLTQEQWQKVVNGLYHLKENGVYDHLAKIHSIAFEKNTVNGTRRSAAHSAPSFAPWHRMFNRVTERCLQSAMNDTVMGMPYLDWMQGWEGVEAYVGPTGDPVADHIVASGPFCNDPRATNLTTCPKKWVLPADFPDSVKGIKRQYGADASYSFMTQAQMDSLMAIPQYDAPPYDNNSPADQSFRNALEWGSHTHGFNHNGLHRWVGGTLSRVTNSFHEPIFLFHHSQVVRVFGLWQKSKKCDDGKGSAVCYRPANRDPTVNETLTGAIAVTDVNGKHYVIQGSMFSDKMYPWGLRVSDLLLADSGSRFLEPKEKISYTPVNSTTTAAASPTISVTPISVSSTTYVTHQEPRPTTIGPPISQSQLRNSAQKSNPLNNSMSFFVGVLFCVFLF